jgi:hypothetical protein
VRLFFLTFFFTAPACPFAQAPHHRLVPSATDTAASCCFFLLAAL